MELIQIVNDTSLIALRSPIALHPILAVKPPSLLAYYPPPITTTTDFHRTALARSISRSRR